MFIVMISVSPAAVSQAKTQRDTEAEDYSSQVKQLTQSIKQKQKHNKKLEAQINKRSKQVSDLYEELFKGNMAPSEEKLLQIEMKEAEVTKSVKLLVQTEKNISKLSLQANEFIKHKNLNQALVALNKLSSLLDKKSDLLTSHSTILQSYIEFIESLELK